MVSPLLWSVAAVDAATVAYLWARLPSSGDWTGAETIIALFSALSGLVVTLGTLYMRHEFLRFEMKIDQRFAATLAAIEERHPTKEAMDGHFETVHELLRSLGERIGFMIRERPRGGSPWS